MLRLDVGWFRGFLPQACGILLNAWASEQASKRRWKRHEFGGPCKGRLCGAVRPGLFVVARVLSQNIGGTVIVWKTVLRYLREVSAGGLEVVGERQ